MMRGAGGEHRPTHTHWTEIAYTLFSDAAVAKVSAIASVHASIAVHEPAHLRPFGADGPAVLAFGFSDPHPTPGVAPHLPAIDLEPYQRFLDEQADAAGRTRVLLNPKLEHVRIQSLAWLDGGARRANGILAPSGLQGARL